MHVRMGIQHLNSGEPKCHPVHLVNEWYSGREEEGRESIHSFICDGNLHGTPFEW